MNPLLLMKPMTLWAKLAIAAALLAAAYGWGRLHESRVAADKISEYVSTVAEAAAEATKRSAERVLAQQRITAQQEIDHAKKLAAALDAGWRERVRFNAAARGDRVPPIPQPATVPHGPAADALAASEAAELAGLRDAYWRLAGECVTTTVALVSLQGWVAAQARLGL